MRTTEQLESLTKWLNFNQADQQNLVVIVSATSGIVFKIKRTLLFFFLPCSIAVTHTESIRSIILDAVHQEDRGQINGTPSQVDNHRPSHTEVSPDDMPRIKKQKFKEQRRHNQLNEHVKCPGMTICRLPCY